MATPAKRARRSAPIPRVTADEWAKQFQDDLYADGGVLFGKICEHCINFVRVDTIKDHLKSQKHASRKKTKLSTAAGSSSSIQVTLSTVVKAKDMRQDFVLDCVKMCTVADIPLEKIQKVRPFFRKYCSQASSLPVDQLRTIYVTRLFNSHFTALKELLRDKHVSITADETTDIRDHSILNVIATIRDQPYLIGVTKMEACNHSTLVRPSSK